MLVANNHFKSYPLPPSKSHQMKTKPLILPFPVAEFYLEKHRLYIYLSTYFLPLFKTVNYDQKLIYYILNSHSKVAEKVRS